MQEELKSIAEKARLEINQAESAEALKAVQVRYLGKKGRITAVLRSMGSLPAAERPVVGKLANQIRDDLTAEIAKGKINCATSPAAGRWLPSGLMLPCRGFPTAGSSTSLNPGNG